MLSPFSFWAEYAGYNKSQQPPDRRLLASVHNIRMPKNKKAPFAKYANDTQEDSDTVIAAAKLGYCNNSIISWLSVLVNHSIQKTCAFARNHMHNATPSHHVLPCYFGKKERDARQGHPKSCEVQLAQRQFTIRPCSSSIRLVMRTNRSNLPDCSCLSGTIRNTLEYIVS